MLNEIKFEETNVPENNNNTSSSKSKSASRVTSPKIEKTKQPQPGHFF